jgi:hypothetical protein
METPAGQGGAHGPVRILGSRPWSHAKVFPPADEISGNEKPGREEDFAAETIKASNQSFSASA